MSLSRHADGPPAVGIVTVLPVPRQSGLTPKQIRGAHCVWCSVQLTAAAVDLGRRQGSFMGVVGPWFPRACDPCTRKEARRIFDIHVTSCERCTQSARPYCPDKVALLRLAGQVEQ
ncbi:hypothetical protein ACGFNQ_02290 [Streptomyces asoensis]|uniref:hypothetical protein n=1 Tax=Streptomyces asoensis TaxID=249586 RepID=UPI0037185D6A